MASWSSKRKFGYFFIFLAAAVLFLVVPSLFLFYRTPTCFDGVQNGNETGVDCGGGCSKLCPADYATPRVLWAYSAMVLPGLYNSLAYIQNPNPSVEASGLAYNFKLYDNQGLLITERAGSAFVPAGQKFAVFEGAIDVGKRIPAKTTFEFTALPDWRPGVMITKLHTENVELTQDANPKAQVDIKNDSVDTGYSNLTAFIILYDKDDNRVSFSKTLVDSIGPGEKQTLFFTWPQAFPLPVVRTEVLFVANR